MAGSFAALMAESKQRTEAVAQQAQEALVNRQRKEEDRKRQQEEREKKERELEVKIRQRHFEEQQRVKEREQRQEKEREERQREQERQRREREVSLLGKGGQARLSSSRSSASRRRGQGADGSDDEGSGAVALTREEKRERRLANEFRLPGASKRSFATGAGARGGRRLPGGAVDVVGSLRTPDSSRAGSTPRETRARLAASSNTLIQVRQKRERRADEIQHDKRSESESKILSGDRARNFGDWFGSKSKAMTSRDGTPAKSRASSTDPVSAASSSSALTRHRFPTKSNARSLPASQSSTTQPSSSHSRPTLPVSKPATKPTKPHPAPAKKRARSPSADSYESEMESPRRKPKISSFQEEIWGIFGKNRDAYVSRDAYSDEDEDMEADAMDVEREEKRSARLARMEDLQAELEEKRREEEKRRRRQVKT